MTDRTRYWIWLSQALGYASVKPKRISTLYNDVKMLYEGGEQEFRYCGIFTENEISKLLSIDLKVADDIINDCKALGYNIFDISEDFYPKKLREIDDPPAVLYVSGTLPSVDNLNCVSIIGTRKATVYGIRTAFELGAALSKKGFVVISGGALGIDCAAHRGVLQADGVTICVLGCGINFDYLKENKGMREQITLKGAVISEYPPGTSASSRNFPQRNRIISALCEGLVVVEAPKASGSMITVNCALAQNKDIFSVMGNVDSPYSEGTNALIKDGAIPVTSYKDILEFYTGVSADESEQNYKAEDIAAVPTKLSRRKDTTATDNKPVATHKTNLSISDMERDIYYLLGLEPMHIDSIAEKSGLPVHIVTRVLSALEMNDLVENVGSRYYSIK
ncbi:MAG: DNA-processing protein DprA [Ruminococcus sp.]|nr:DNA-processing protein DprA [Ruminococcus sp.]